MRWATVHVTRGWTGWIWGAGRRVTLHPDHTHTTPPLSSSSRPAVHLRSSLHGCGHPDPGSMHTMPRWGTVDTARDGAPPPPPSRIHRPRGQQASNYYRAQGRGAAGHDGVCGQYIPIGRSCRDAWIPRHSRTESIVDGAEGGGGGSTPILDTMRILTAASHGLKNPVQAARKQPSTGTWRTVFSAPPPRCERVRCGYSAGRGSICRQHCRRAGRDQAGLGYTRPFLWARRRHTRDGVYGGGRHSTKRHRRGRIGSQGTWQADAELLSLTICWKWS